MDLQERLSQYGDWLLEQGALHFSAYVKEGKPIPAHATAEGPLGAFQRHCKTFRNMFVPIETKTDETDSKWGRD